MIDVLGHHGVTQGRIASLTGLPQGRLSEYKNHRRTPKATSTFEDFANGMMMPPVARQALGLSPGPLVKSSANGAVPDGEPSDVGLAYPDAPRKLPRMSLGYGGPILTARGSSRRV